MSFEGQRVFVGGGSSGIGRAVALELARRGAHVVVGGRDLQRLQDVVAEMEALANDPARRFGHAAFDVVDREATRAAVPGVLDRLGGLDALVLCQGYARPGYVHELADEVFDEMIAVNYLGHVHLVRAFLPTLMAQKSGRICILSSMLGFFSSFGYSAYSGSKYAVAGFAEALRHELRPHGVRVTLFYPPTTQTPGLDKENESKPKAVWAYESASGWNRIYSAEQVAGAVLKAMEGRRFENVIGWDSWLIFYAFRLLPGLARWLNDGELDKAVKKVEGQG